MGKWKLRAKEFSRICDAYSAAFDEVQDLVCEPDERQFGVRHTIDLLRSRMIELQQLRVLRLRQNAEDWGEVAGSVLGPMLGPMITEPEERVCSGRGVHGQYITLWGTWFGRVTPCATMTGCRRILVYGFCQPLSWNTAGHAHPCLDACKGAR